MTEQVLTGLTVGQVERKYGVSERTLRFYEEKGLLSPPRVNNRRAYQDTCLERLEVILKCKTCGLPINDIWQVLQVLEGSVDDADATDAITRLLADHVAKLEAQMQVLSTYMANADDFSASLPENVSSLRLRKPKQNAAG